MAAYIDLSRIPFIPGRLHATNNPYQRYGPKGFMEIKVLPNDDLYVRVDLPGVPDDAIRHRVDSVRQKVVFFSDEETLGDGDKVDDVREYSGTAGLGCDFGEITGVEAKMKDGVLRMILSRVKVKDHDNKCTNTLPPNAGKSGRYDLNTFDFVEVEDHPFVLKGLMTCSCLLMRMKSSSMVRTKDVYKHDESCRIFIGAVDKRACCSYGIPLLSHNIAWDAEFGVLKVRVSPPRNNNDQ